MFHSIMCKNQLFFYKVYITLHLMILSSGKYSSIKNEKEPTDKLPKDEIWRIRPRVNILHEPYHILKCSKRLMHLVYSVIFSYMTIDIFHRVLNFEKTLTLAVEECQRQVSNSWQSKMIFWQSVFFDLINV